MGEDYFDSLSSSELKSFVLRHIVFDEYYVKDMYKMNKLETLNQDSIIINNINGLIKIENSRILFKNQKIENGIIHYIYPPLTN